ncbi:MAG: undecaprenyl-diphosphate phosphatase, partial [Elusimicrobiota bacterium]|nr:undecaprenyl-diphosphate phosphatase [Elusimicrobiota bacterium]
MSILNAILLGVIQAAGEFLPVSSSAHLVLFSFFFGGEYQGLAFDVALHLATLAAVLGYFRRDVFALAKAGFYAPKSAAGRLFWYIGIASIPAAVCGYFMGDIAEHTLRSPMLIAALLIIFGALLMFADRRGGTTGNKREVFTLGAMLLIGCAQALALAPGV